MTFKQVKVSAIQGTPNADADRLKFYTAEVPASAVASFTVERALDVEGGFQRPFDLTRAKRIGMLMGGDRKKKRNPMPHVHGGLLAYADADDIYFTPRTNKLTIKRPLHLLDGQTRAGGAAWAVEHGMVSDYTETVRIVVGATHEELVNWFLVTNMTARKVQPPSILLNVATMTGTHQRRKAWVARTTVNLATEAPFVRQGDGKFFRIVSFAQRDGGRIPAYTLYKAVNFMLPDNLNREGAAVEKKALHYAREALRLYASFYEEAWGKVDDNGKLIPHDAYSFTLLATFARLYKAVKAASAEDANMNVADTIRKVWSKAGLSDGIPEGSGLGERAALSLASYLASEANVGPLKVSQAA